MRVPTVVIVVPAYNEAARLSLPDYRAALESDDGLQMIFVDDASDDGSAALLGELVEEFPERVVLVANETNRGKGESVRRGLLLALETGAPEVGYWDADLATPLDELAAFRAALAEPGRLAIFGSRLKLLGRRVERSALRHYLGRVYATLISMTLRLGIYDSQCGAKLLKAGPQLREILAEPFRSRWLFDVEILARLIVASRSCPELHPERSVVELPLRQWVDAAGSKVRPRDALVALRDLWRIRRQLAR